MIGGLNHVGIAVPDLAAAVERYRALFGVEAGDTQTLAQHGVRVAFVELPNARIELIEPFGENSPLRSFLAKHPDGGLHHVCYEVHDLEAAAASLQAQGLRVLGDGKPRRGAAGNPVIFLHPAGCFGTLVELEEVR